MNNINIEKESEKKPFLLKLAKLIRALTVPPIMVTALLLILLFGADVFPETLDFIFSLVFLAVVPVLAYVAQKLLPGWKDGGQKAQRKLAFFFQYFGLYGCRGRQHRERRHSQSALHFACLSGFGGHFDPV